MRSVSGRRAAGDAAAAIGGSTTYVVAWGIGLPIEQAARLKAAHAARPRRSTLIGIPGKLDLLGRAADERAGRVALDGFRQHAQVVRGHAQVLDDHADVVLIVADQRIEPFRRVVDALDHAVQVAVVRELAHAGADRRDVVDRLLEPRVGEERVEPGRGRIDLAQRLVDGRRGQGAVDALERRVGVLEHVLRLCGELCDRHLADLLVHIDDERVQILAQRLDVRLVEVRQERLGVGDDLAGKTGRRRYVRVFRGPRERERRVFRRVEEVDARDTADR